MPILGPPGALSPRDWEARVDYDTWTDLYTPDDGVALHHGGGSDYRAGREPYSQAEEIKQLRSWESFHIDGRGWRGLAYGWAVGQSGTIYRARGWASYGAHTGDVDGDGIANNSEIIPILFIGSGSHHQLSPTAQASILSLRRFIEDQAPAAQYLYGHQELKGTITSCPGPYGMAYVTANRYLPEPEDDMLPIGPSSPTEDIRSIQGLLNTAFNAGLVENGSWDAATKAAASKHLGSSTGDPSAKVGEYVNARMYRALLIGLVRAVAPQPGDTTGFSKVGHEHSTISGKVLIK